MKEQRIPVAREGYPFIGFAAFMSILFGIVGYDIFAFVSLAITAFVLYFFRDPARISSDEKDVMVSPADGKVIIIDKVFDERFVKEHVYKVSIFMNVFNVHVNRIPFGGEVTHINYKQGRFYSADSERGGLHNEYCAVTMKTDTGHRMAVVQIAGLIARRIVCWARPGDRLQRGERYGLIRFGSRVDLYLPLQTQLEVKVGQKVRAGETILGYLS